MLYTNEKSWNLGGSDEVCAFGHEISAELPRDNQGNGGTAI